MMTERDAQRFWSKVDKSGDCWIWKGARFKQRNGLLTYGMFSVDQKPKKAHRISYELVRGCIPTGFKVLHQCDNTACVRPDHLFIGSQLDNIADCVLKRRNRNGPYRKVGEENIHHVLTEAQVLFIRKSERSNQQLANDFGVGKSTIGHIRKRRTWRHI